MCDPGCSCDELSEEDIECENPRTRRAQRWHANHAKTSCGLRPYYPHDDDDDYPEPIPVTTISYQILTPLWKPRKIRLPSVKELMKKFPQSPPQPQKSSENEPILPTTN
jgi:hypothetical protein